MTREQRREKAEQGWQELSERITADLEMRVKQEALARQGKAFLAAHPKALSRR